jgi:predicted small metal-binding protein
MPLMTTRGPSTPSRPPPNANETMPLTVSCPRCEALIEARDEDELVTKVQQHAREDHGLDHTLPRKHILANLARQTKANQ